MKKRSTHWTADYKDFAFAVAAQFIMQIEKEMDEQNCSQRELAERLSLSEGRVSQILNLDDSANFELGSIVKLARSLDRKVGVVAYDDGDVENRVGPINPEVFVTCWERCGKPKDLWPLQTWFSSSAPNAIGQLTFDLTESLSGPQTEIRGVTVLEDESSEFTIEEMSNKTELAA